MLTQVCCDYRVCCFLFIHEFVPDWPGTVCTHMHNCSIEPLFANVHECVLHFRCRLCSITSLYTLSLYACCLLNLLHCDFGTYCLDYAVFAWWCGRVCQHDERLATSPYMIVRVSAGNRKECYVLQNQYVASACDHVGMGLCDSRKFHVTPCANVSVAHCIHVGTLVVMFGAGALHAHCSCCAFNLGEVILAVSMFSLLATGLLGAPPAYPELCVVLHWMLTVLQLEPSLCISNV